MIAGRGQQADRRYVVVLKPVPETVFGAWYLIVYCPESFPGCDQLYPGVLAAGAMMRRFRRSDGTQQCEGGRPNFHSQYRIDADQYPDPDARGTLRRYTADDTFPGMMTNHRGSHRHHDKGAFGNTFLAENRRLQRQATGRPSPLAQATRLSRFAGGARIFLDEKT